MLVPIKLRPVWDLSRIRAYLNFVIKLLGLFIAGHGDMIETYKYVHGLYTVTEDHMPLELVQIDSVETSLDIYIYIDIYT